jgi:toxin ParE1/3/4
MSGVIRKTLQARVDLVEIADYLAQGSLAAAERFLQAAEQAFAGLAAMPGLGSPWESSNPRLQEVRTWSVPGFRKYLVFYRPTADGIDVLRVLHGARDLDAVLGEDGG